MTIDGDVVAVYSHWTDDGSRIVTEATVRTPDGQDVVVSQLGGSVDGIGMITFPGPPMLALGMKVAVAAHRGVDLEQREHIVLDDAKVTSYPPDFVRTGPTKAGHYLKWESGCVFVTIDSAGTSSIAGDQEFAAIDAAIETWSSATSTCSYLDLVNNGRKASEVGRDNTNLIKIRDTGCTECNGSWCRPAIGKDPQRCYSAQAAGLTTAIFIDDASSPRDGAILDADIELNGVDFAISLAGATTSSKPCHAELQNTLTHELGHLQGLEHPCITGTDPPRVDDQGNPVPTCPSSDPKIFDATMYNFQECGEMKKETLSSDDINAICTVYPKSADPGACDPVGTKSGCCSTSDRPAASFLLAGVVLFALRRRKSR
jgi:MYXO-CTERM domain-containing protein